MKALVTPTTAGKHKVAVESQSIYLYWCVLCLSELDSLRWFSQRRSPTPHFWGAHPGVYDPHIRTRPRFLYSNSTPTVQVSSSYVYSFGIIMLTNKQTLLKTSDALRCMLWRLVMIWMHVSSVCLCFSLIQAHLGCLPLQDFALLQDVNIIMRAAARISHCTIMTNNSN